MRNTQAVKAFIDKWHNLSVPTREILYDYMPICKNLLYEDEETIVNTIKILRKNVSMWAATHCAIYQQKQPIPYFTKADLDDKANWYVRFMEKETQPMTSSGSTTGHNFAYLRWEPFLYFIECENHYDMIMDENRICENPNILYMFNALQGRGTKMIQTSNESKNFMEHHGKKRKATVHYANPKVLKENSRLFFSYLFRQLKETHIDVMLAPGSSVRAMCASIKSEGFKGKVCDLLSNTNEYLLPEDRKFLIENKHVGSICDHMRCWDGGASFFECKYGTIHLMDNLAWCVEKEKKLVSTDYFSLPSPFVNFWNGDRCEIENKYQKCKCGRMFRPFKFLENRPFAVKGNSIKEYREKMVALGISDIRQIRCDINFFVISSTRRLSDSEKLEIRKIFAGHEVRFLVEQ